jgi:GxxExxY protein
MVELLYKDEVYKIIGAAMEVHRELGPGFLEAIYQEAMEIEMADRDIPFISQPQLKVYFKKRELEKFYVPDFLCYDKIVVEIKATKHLTEIDESQIFNSTRVAKYKLGVLVNFGTTSLEWKRYVI